MRAQTHGSKPAPTPYVATHNKVSFPLAIFIAGLLASSAYAPAVAALPDYMSGCTDPYLALQSAKAPLIDPATSVDVQSTGPRRAQRIRVTGDLVVIDEKTLSSLIAQPQDAMVGVRKLTFDARKLIIDAPISIAGGSISLLAQQIVFGPRAHISLLKGSNGSRRTLEVVARHVDFNDAPPSPFNLDLSADTNATATATIVDAGSVTTPLEFWKKFSDSSDHYEPFVPGATEIGPNARRRFQASFANRMNWPIYFASNLRSAFAAAPFSEALDKDLQSLITEEGPFLEKWRSTGPYAILSEIHAAIQAHTNLDGWSIYHVPYQRFDVQLSALTDDLNDSDFTGLARVIADSAVDSDSDASVLARTTGALAKAMTVERSLRESIDAAMQKTKTLAGRLSSEKDEVNTEEQKLQMEAQQRARQKKTAKEILRDGELGAAAATIALTAGGASAFWVTAAPTAVALASQKIADNNAGGQHSLTEWLSIGKRDYRMVRSLRQLWSAVQGKYEAADQAFMRQSSSGDRDSGVTLKAQAVAQLMRSLSAMVSESKGLADQAAQDLPIDPKTFQGGDPFLSKSVRAAADLRQQIYKVGVTIATDSKELVAVTAKVSALRAQSYALRLPIARNDRGDALWRAFAYSTWERDVDRLDNDLQNLRLALFLETGQPPPVAMTNSTAKYPEAIASRLALERIAGNAAQLTCKSKAAASVGDPAYQNLMCEAKRIQSTVNDLRERLLDEDRRYRAHHPPLSVTRVRSMIPENPRAATAAERRFLKEINAQIAKQLVDHVVYEDLAPVLIPISPPDAGANPAPLITDSPESIRVLSARFKSRLPERLKDRIIFIVIHPQYGIRSVDGNCYYVDFRPKLGPRGDPYDYPYVRPYATPFVDMPHDAWLAGESHEALSNDYALLPGDAPYFLRVEITPDSHSSVELPVPVLKSITLGFEVEY